MLGKLKSLLISNTFWIIVLAVAFLLLFWNFSGKLNAERLERAQDLQNQERAISERLASERKGMEETYRKNIQEYKKTLEAIQGERKKLEEKIRTIEGRISAIQASRAEVERRVYSRPDLDSKFHAILTRGK